MGPLGGIRILDLTRLLPGAYCSMTLADLGAHVLKVEEPRLGDYSRWEEPHMGAESYYHLALNRNKESLRLDLKAPAGQALFLELVSQYDIVFENFRPGVMERLGLGYERLAAVNPRIICCSLAGFGPEHPAAPRAAHDLNLLALGGFLSLCGPPGGPPGMPAVPIADLMSSLWAALAMLAALRERDASGRGQQVHIPMFNVVLSSLTMVAGKYYADPAAVTNGELTGAASAYNIYRTRDGQYMALGAWEQPLWASFCRAAGRPDLAELPRNSGPEVLRELQELFAQRTRAEWEAVAATGDFCLTPVLSLPEVLADPVLTDTGAIFNLLHPTVGVVPQVAIPARFSRTPTLPQGHTPPPGFGEQTRDVLRRLGKDEDTIDDLLAKGVIA